MNHFIQPKIPLITGECAYEYSIPKNKDIEYFWYNFHKKLLLKYNNLSQRKYSCVIEKEIRVLLNNDQIDFFTAFSYFIEKIRFYKKELFPETVNFWIQSANEFSMFSEKQTYLRLPYQILYIDKKLIPGLASYLFGLKRENEFLSSSSIPMPKTLKAVIEVLSENKFPKKLEYKLTPSSKKLNLSSIKGYQEYKNQDFPKITLIKIYKILTKDQKKKANDFLESYKEKKNAALRVQMPRM